MCARPHATCVAGSTAEPPKRTWLIRHVLMGRNASLSDTVELTLSTWEAGAPPSEKRLLLDTPTAERWPCSVAVQSPVDAWMDERSPGRGGLGCGESSANVSPASSLSRRRCTGCGELSCNSVGSCWCGAAPRPRAR